MQNLTCWSTETRAEDGVCILMLDVPDAGANTLSQLVLEELEHIVAQLEADTPKGLIIVSGKADSFIAGADINEFPKLTDRAAAITLITQGQDLFQRIDFPTSGWEARPGMACCHSHLRGTSGML